MADLPGSAAEATRAAEGAAARLQLALQQPLWLSAAEIDVRASIGISVYPFDAATPRRCSSTPTPRCTRPRRPGATRPTSTSPAREPPQDRSSSPRGSAAGSSSEELTLHYQPIVDLQSGALMAVEALVRWNDPIRGLIPPAEFIPVAERSGLIRPISEWVLGEASRQAAVWRAAGYDLPISVNVPPDTCQQIGAAAIERLIRAPGGEPSRITLEMTESAMMTRRRGDSDEMEALCALGIRLAIDDFGTGHSSLARLGEFPVSVLKIDRSFVSGLPEVDAARTLVTAILYLADGFGLDVIAEGVETEAHRRFLLDAGCRYAQGYLFSPAVEPAQITRDWPPDVPAHTWVDARRGAAVAEQLTL